MLGAAGIRVEGHRTCCRSRQALSMTSGNVRSAGELISPVVFAGGRPHNAGMSTPPPQGRSPAGPAVPSEGASAKPIGGRSDASPAAPAARADAPRTSRLGRLAQLGALAPRALPVAAEAVRRAVGGRRSAD